MDLMLHRTSILNPVSRLPHRLSTLPPNGVAARATLEFGVLKQGPARSFAAISFGCLRIYFRPLHRILDNHVTVTDYVTITALAASVQTE